jgi:hypothetical protein
VVWGVTRLLGDSIELHWLVLPLTPPFLQFPGVKFADNCPLIVSVAA